MDSGLIIMTLESGLDISTPAIILHSRSYNTVSGKIYVVLIKGNRMKQSILGFCFPAREHIRIHRTQNRKSTVRTFIHI